jgi:hypothetical protein
MTAVVRNTSEQLNCSTTSFLLPCNTTQKNAMRVGFLTNRGDIIGSLFVKNSASLPESSLADIRAQASHITHLQLDFSARSRTLTLAQLQTLAEVCTNVGSIHVKGTRVTSSFLKNMALAWPNITGFTIEGSTSLEDQELVNVINRLDYLSQLSLISCAKITDYFLTCLPIGNRPIKRLELKDMKNITFFGVQMLSTLQTLEELKVTHLYQLDKAFQHLKKANTKLIVEEIDEGLIQAVIDKIKDVWEDCRSITVRAFSTVCYGLYGLHQAFLWQVLYPIQGQIFSCYLKISKVFEEVLLEIEITADRVITALDGKLFDLVCFVENGFYALKHSVTEAYFSVAIPVENHCYKISLSVRNFFQNEEPAQAN